jgi:hypothetical protein
MYTGEKSVRGVKEKENTKALGESARENKNFLAVFRNLPNRIKCS